MRWHGWARDTFTNGGLLVDADRWYGARDKVQHVVAFLLLWLLLALLPLPWLLRLALWEAASCSVELIEWARYDEWQRPGADLTAWPNLADRPSWRDMVANHVGLVLASTYLWLLSL